MREGDNIEVDIIRVTDENKGVGRSSDGKIVLVEGILDGDESVRAKIDQIGEETIFATRTTRISIDGGTQKTKGLVDNPYDLDNDEGEPEEDDE